MMVTMMVMMMVMMMMMMMKSWTPVGYYLIIKIGPQCVLGVLCLNLVLSDGMLFSDISIWELNYCKWTVRQVITTFKWKMYGRILFSYFIFISNNNLSLLCKKGVHGQSHVTDITFRGQILELKLFLTYFS